MKKGRKMRFAIIFVILLLLLSSTATFAGNGHERFNMSYLYFGSPDNYVQLVDRTNNSLNMVSPNYFDVNQEGNLVFTDKFRESFVADMHSRGIKVVPFLANHWDRTAGENAFKNRHALSTEVAEYVETYNLDGINVDIEGVGHAYRDEHTDFIRLLREKIPAHKEVSVAVAANPNGWTTGWHGNYDYTELAKHADYLMIMAYDEHWQGSTPGPVASYSFVERSIQYALNQQVPKEKVVIGIPFYGRIWKTDGERNADGFLINGRGISHNQIQTVVNHYNGDIIFDEASQTPKAVFTVTDNDPIISAEGVRLTAGDYVIWFDNEQSFKKKLELINLYDIKGTGSWALMREDPHMWDYYKTYLNGGTIGTEPEEDVVLEPDPIEEEPVVEPEPTPEVIEEKEEVTSDSGNNGRGNGKGHNKNTTEDVQHVEGSDDSQLEEPIKGNNGNGNGNGNGRNR
ncbi:hypothetical protein HXZ66_11450 [Bacillus sp. A116_S68]|nr:hypothetical protein HXZ66_11450 [Bacillus sp. A116_S68]